MADGLICKGKFINKLTGTGSQIKKLKDSIKLFEKNQDAKEQSVGVL